MVVRLLGIALVQRNVQISRSVNLFSDMIPNQKSDFRTYEIKAGGLLHLAAACGSPDPINAF
jgi:hypothetical protein